jgi:hypothetical protein
MITRIVVRKAAPPVARPPVRNPSPAELALKAALATSVRQGHSASIAHAVGIWPA